MNTEILMKQNIYAIPAGDMWELPEHSVYVIYAPLGGHISLATEDTVKELVKCADGEIVNRSEKH